ncbi:hypothetical protein E4T43_00014 [Aureobasidium subglaciale]|nr:hypothetical protein E4T43_00014 [Aureobasidium subglaciale]
MDEKRLLQIHRDPADPWHVLHIAAQIFNNQILLDPNHNAVAAARHLNLLTPFNRTMRPDETTEDIESFLWEFWEVVVNLSQAYDGEKSDIAQSCIVDVLAKLQGIEAKDIVVWGNATRLRRDLPLFGSVLNEMFADGINRITLTTRLEVRE